jgi:hypothetical protein
MKKEPLKTQKIKSKFAGKSKEKSTWQYTK